MKILFFIILSILFSCSVTEQNSQNQYFDPLSIIENYDSSWDSKKITTLLGPPNEMIKEKNGYTWIYREDKKSLNKWQIALTSENKIAEIIYFPSGGKQLFFVKYIEDRWISKKCEDKKTSSMVLSHIHTSAGTLSCESNRFRATYNRDNIIESIVVNSPN